MSVIPVIINFICFFPPSIEKSLYIFENLPRVLLFPLSVFSYSSETQADPSMMSQPQLHVCSASLSVYACFQFERLLIFVSNVYYSPDTHHSSSLGRHAPSFLLSTSRQRPPHRPHRLVLFTKSCQQQQLLMWYSNTSGSIFSISPPTVFHLQ